MAIKKPTALVILDGFGYRKDRQYNAIAHARMRHFNQWLSQYPHALLQASGHFVGLPDGTPGNSLVGHMALGTGRVIKQPITVLNEEIQDGSFFKNPVLVGCLQQLRETGGTLHLMGLLSDGSSHSNEVHLYALLRAAKQQGITKIVVHAFLDGRDVPPRSAAEYLTHLDTVLKEIGVGRLGSIHGRAYPMDRNEHWEYVRKSYNLMTEPNTKQFATWRQALDYYYGQGLTDEMIPPTCLADHSEIKDGDGLIFFNIRADRARNLTRLFLEHMHPRLLWFITAVPYSSSFNTQVLYEPPQVEQTLLDVLEEHHKRMFVIAEHEKYAHVTYFFNGGREIVHSQESRMIIPSLPPEKFEEHPEMSAPEITDAVIRSLTKNPRDFYLINYANPDMIGHTGNFDATVKAVACIDEQLYKLYQQIVEKMQGTLYIVSDHGKAEDMFDTGTQQARTAHTTNPVWFMMIRKDLNGTQSGLDLSQLADVALFILREMGLAVPPEMTGGVK